MLKSSDPLYRRIRVHAKKRIRFLPDVAKKDRLKGYKEFLRLEREMLVRHHRNGESGIRGCQARAIVTDVLIESIFRTALITFSEKHGVLPCKCTLVAHGGYGRGELSPASDIDILFLFPDKTKSSMVEAMKTVLTDEVLYPLWDLGFKLGHATRTTKECLEEAETDFKTRNSLLEIRRVLGSTEVYDDLVKKYKEYLDRKNKLPILQELISIQKKRRQQYGDSVFVAEPNIKNGVGGLRDFQGVFWMIQLMFGDRKLSNLYAHDHLHRKEAAAFRKAYDFLLWVRTELHNNSKRPNDELTLGIQPLVAEQLGYQGESLERVEDLMKDYYYHSQRCLSIVLSLEKRILERFSGNRRNAKRNWFQNLFEKVKVERIDGFVIEDDWIDAENDKIFDEDPARILRLFRIVQQQDLQLTVSLERLVEAKLDLLNSNSKTRLDISEVFREIMKEHGKVHFVLEQMYRLGVLVKILPEFEQLHCFIQHDRHLLRYSEDEKVIKSIFQLDRLVSDEDVARTKEILKLEEGSSLTDLYWLLLLYSLIYRRTNSGNRVSNLEDSPEFLSNLLDRLGLDDNRAERIVSFVDSHSKVARFWHDAELHDASMIKKLAVALKTHENAIQSFQFYYCESLGRNPQYWELHSLPQATKVLGAVEREIEVGTASMSEDTTSVTKKEMTRADIAKRTIVGVTTDEVDAHFMLLPDRYFESRNTIDIELHIQLVHELLETIQQADSLGSLKPIVDWKNDGKGGFSVINIVTWDRLGLFYKLAGAISAVGLNILKASAVSRNDHIAIDTFYVSHGKTGQVECDEVKEKFEDAVESILVGGEKAYGLVREQYLRGNKKDWSNSRNLFDLSLPVQVDVHWDKELKQVVVDYQGTDRIGLLYRISRHLFLRGYNLDSIRISSANYVASGTILMSKEAGVEPDDADKLSEIREKLIEILSSEVWLSE